MSQIKSTWSHHRSACHGWPHRQRRRLRKKVRGGGHDATRISNITYEIDPPYLHRRCGCRDCYAGSIRHHRSHVGVLVYTFWVTKKCSACRHRRYRVRVRGCNDACCMQLDVMNDPWCERARVWFTVTDTTFQNDEGSKLATQLAHRELPVSYLVCTCATFRWLVKTRLPVPC